MTPGARVAAAVAVLDDWLSGEPAERGLIRWARGARYAGSGDRAAVRDHVYDALRRLRSSAAWGGAMTGRGVALGLLAGRGEDAAALFDGRGHAPPPLSPEERARLAEAPSMTRSEALDVPDWLLGRLDADLGARTDAVLAALRHRAPLHLRANLARLSRGEAAEALTREGVETRPHPLSPSALEVTEGARRLKGTRAYAEGLVEIQDAASQAVADSVPSGGRILDLCAGGGGKALALAARGAGRILAHDAERGRMRDLPARAERAGAEVTILREPGSQAPYDVVLADAPCSGSGTWRRDPEGKWRLTPERLEALCRAQDAILDTAAGLTGSGGAIAYVTCSLLEAENGARVAAFLDRRPGWGEEGRRRLTPLDGGDGFALSILRRRSCGAPSRSPILEVHHLGLSKGHFTEN